MKKIFILLTLTSSFLFATSITECKKYEDTADIWFNKTSPFSRTERGYGIKANYYMLKYNSCLQILTINKQDEILKKLK